MRVVCSSPGWELPSGVLVKHIGLEAPEPFQGGEDVVAGSARGPTGAHTSHSHSFSRAHSLSC